MGAPLTRRRLVAGGAVVAACALAAGLWIWTSDEDEPPGSVPDGATRITTPEQVNGGNPSHTIDSPDQYLPEAARITLWGMTGTTRIADDGTLTVLFTLDHLDGPGDEWGPLDQGDEHLVDGLTEGDTVEAGAVSFEVIRIWDADDDDHDATDVRVTFDETRLDEPLPGAEDITVR